ncbi:phospholipid-transporting ATPase ABCA1-like isoform X2 [Coccinella septempunctata]|uniref:phospholipid-transporting ATPase ABCA1-like isoform X2 n=1 Tax=Coccinella septempunctata TaxID=41139 RepID=UPI001D06A7D7|nr:phospholipid-transporting ATPase ABCA1-like isoform X2 [Coccinella septempunctata]
MGCWDKFFLLMWKNWKLQLRRPISFAAEVGIPLVVVAIILNLRSQADLMEMSEVKYDPFSVDTFDKSILRAYSPNTNKFVNELMKSYKPSGLLKGFETAAKLEDYLLNHPAKKTPKCGVVFDDDLPDGELTGKINIKLRFDTSSNYLSDDWKVDSLYPDITFMNGERDDTTYYSHGGPPDYTNFDSVMYSLTSKIFAKRKITFPNVILERFPRPAYSYDQFYPSLCDAFFFGFLFMAAFVYSSVSMVKAITLEKERQLKESMKVMGLPTWLHWTAWFVQMFTPLLPVAIIMAISMKLSIGGTKIMEYSDVGLLFLFFLLYTIQVITFSFAVSVFFSKANRATSLAGMIWILAMVPYIIIRCGNYGKISAFMKYFTSLLAPSAISYGLDLICLFEVRKIGAQWSNLFERNPQIGITFGGILLMMFMDIFVYLGIALYVEQIYPGEFGVPQKWYFLFTRQFWSREEVSSSTTGRQSTMKGEFFEEEPLNLRAGIKIENLCKTFGANDAVKDLSMNLYEDQITVLLGHNGAGKTTTMSMLTGMFPPTKGTATINGFDISTQIMRVRDSMGLCPQHNVLFDDLTVTEHLIFFSKLKGCKGEQVDAEVRKFLKLLSLEDKANAKSSELSGGMKRKLCVGIALCGNSKVIMLDEPTAGMDPSARRFIWEFLQEQKKGRTILLTTHFMDEADLLGDRIAIMSGGELKCCGSSFFLKKKYGAGYHLVIDQLPNCQPNAITRLLAEHIPAVHIESNAGTELTYLLPEKYSSTFPSVLSQLEENSSRLGIRSFGISLTDLEEVFMKVGTNETGRMVSNETNHHNVEGYTNVTINSTYLETGTSLYMNQIRAIFWKKYLVAVRSWMTEIMKTLLPLLYIFLVVYSTSSGDNSKDEGYREFSLADYDNPITLVDGSKVAKQYEDLLNSQQQKYEVVDDVGAVAENMTIKDLDLIKYTYLIGASYDDTIQAAIAWFSNEPLHTVPLTLQMMMNSFIPDRSFQLNFINYPLPKRKTDEDILIQEITKSINSIMAISLAAAYVGNFYVMFNIRERMCQAKHLQFVSGINVYIFWLISFIADFITYLIPSIAIIIAFSILQPKGLASFESLSYLALIMFDFGVVVMPFMYVCSYLFTVPSTGYSRMWFISFTAGFPAVFIMYILDLLDSSYAVIKWILRIIPHYVLTEGVFDIMHVLPTSTKETNGESVDDDALLSFHEHSLGTGIAITYVTTVIFFGILFLIDLKILSNLMYKIFPDRTIPNPPSTVDEDVNEENQKVRNSPMSQLLDQNLLVLKDLTKNYKGFTAVNGLNLTVKKAECFGLLGVNGAGKTTTFKMMTGDEMISSGDGWINGFSIRSQMKEVQSCIGYCPQFDALIDNLTARETLKIFGLIRGVPKDECDFTAERLARDFDFTQHLDKQVKQLSGGNKRKLSTAIALIGDAPIIFLDEPTTGMDPGTKRHLWNRLSNIRASGKSIILTSHSMEECEALCTRLVIMVNGNFQCLGSIQHLKSRFSEGFSVTLKIKKIKNSSGMEHRDTTPIENFMNHNFRGCELREKHQELLNYYIKDRDAKWSQLFGTLEKAKAELDIEDYSIGQASLEQVFLTFTKQQKTQEAPQKRKKRCCGLCC